MKINIHSILFKINIAFLLIFIILLSSYFFAYGIIMRVETFNFIRKTVLLTKKNKLEDGKFFGINLVNNKKTASKILKNGKPFLKRKPPRLNYTLTLLKFKGIEYIYLKSKTKKTAFLLEKNPESYDRQEILTAACLSLVFIIILLYISIYRSIRPLNMLKNKIEEFKNGDVDINLDPYTGRKDEIGYVAKEFKEAADSVKKTLNARTWFIRNIAHELKTPITRGRIALELLKNEDESKKKVFTDIFTRMEMLINELFSSEKIAAGNKELNLTLCNLSDVINRAEEFLFVNDGDNDKNIEVIADGDYSVNADFELLSIAIKNLIDNAIKFGDDKKVTVGIKNGFLSFINKGNKPAIPKDLMFEPFLKDADIKNKDGFGLGLYITKQILEKHGLKIEYKYTEGKNIFSIDLRAIIINK
ncbi:MAG: ArsS family sensor histidine kinase [bacterium]